MWLRQAPPLSVLWFPIDRLLLFAPRPLSTKTMAECEQGPVAAPVTVGMPLAASARSQPNEGADILATPWRTLYLSRARRSRLPFSPLVLYYVEFVSPVIQDVRHNLRPIPSEKRLVSCNSSISDLAWPIPVRFFFFVLFQDAEQTPTRAQ